METRPIAELLDRLQHGVKKQNESPQKCLDDRHIIRFFSRMVHLFGHKWASTYGDAVSGEVLSASGKQWQYDLRALSQDDVARGIEAVIQLRMEWPPGPIDFLAICDKVRVKDWRETSHGIEAKGAELGLKPETFPHWPAFKDAVFAADKPEAYPAVLPGYVAAKHAK